MNNKNEFIQKQYEMEEIITGKKYKAVNVYNNLQRWFIYDSYGPGSVSSEFSFKTLFQMLVQRFPKEGNGTEADMETILGQHHVTILDALDGKALYQTVKEEVNNVKARTWTKRLENAVEKYVGLVHPIGNFHPCSDGLGTDIDDVEICWLVEWLEASNKQMEEKQKECHRAFRKKMYQDVKEYFKNCLDSFPSESISLYHSGDDKGYIWVRQDQINRFESLIMPYEGCYFTYDEEDAEDKMIGEKSCPSGYREYAYIPYYDCRDIRMDDDFFLLIEKALFETMRVQKLIVINKTPVQSDDFKRTK